MMSRKDNILSGDVGTAKISVKSLLNQLETVSTNGKDLKKDDIHNRSAHMSDFVPPQPLESVLADEIKQAIINSGSITAPLTPPLPPNSLPSNDVPSIISLDHKPELKDVIKNAVFASSLNTIRAIANNNDGLVVEGFSPSKSNLSENESSLPDSSNDHNFVSPPVSKPSPSVDPQKPMSIQQMMSLYSSLPEETLSSPLPPTSRSQESQDDSVAYPLKFSSPTDALSPPSRFSDVSGLSRPPISQVSHRSPFIVGTRSPAAPTDENISSGEQYPSQQRMSPTLLSKIIASDVMSSSSASRSILQTAQENFTSPFSENTRSQAGSPSTTGSPQSIMAHTSLGHLSKRSPPSLVGSAQSHSGDTYSSSSRSMGHVEHLYNAAAASSSYSVGRTPYGPSLSYTPAGRARGSTSHTVEELDVPMINQTLAPVINLTNLPASELVSSLPPSTDTLTKASDVPPPQPPAPVPVISLSEEFVTKNASSTTNEKEKVSPGLRRSNSLPRNAASTPRSQAATTASTARTVPINICVKEPQVSPAEATPARLKQLLRNEKLAADAARRHAQQEVDRLLQTLEVERVAHAEHSKLLSLELERSRALIMQLSEAPVLSLPLDGTDAQTSIGADSVGAPPSPTGSASSSFSFSMGSPGQSANVRISRSNLSAIHDSLQTSRAETAVLRSRLQNAQDDLDGLRLALERSQEQNEQLLEASRAAGLQSQLDRGALANLRLELQRERARADAALQRAAAAEAATAQRTEESKRVSEELLQARASISQLGGDSAALRDSVAAAEQRQLAALADQRAQLEQAFKAELAAAEALREDLQRALASKELDLRDAVLGARRLETQQQRLEQQLLEAQEAVKLAHQAAREEFARELSQRQKELDLEHRAAAMEAKEVAQTETHALQAKLETLQARFEALQLQRLNESELAEKRLADAVRNAENEVSLKKDTVILAAKAEIDKLRMELEASNSQKRSIKKLLTRAESSRSFYSASTSVPNVAISNKATTPTSTTNIVDTPSVSSLDSVTIVAPTSTVATNPNSSTAPIPTHTPVSPPSVIATAAPTPLTSEITVSPQNTPETEKEEVMVIVSEKDLGLDSPSTPLVVTTSNEESKEEKSSNDIVVDEMESRLESIFASNDAEISRLLSQLSNERAAAEVSMNALVARHNSELSSLRSSYESQLSVLKETHTSEIAELKRLHQQELDSLNQSHSLALESLRRSSSEQFSSSESLISSLKSSHQQELNSLRSAHSDAMDSLEKEKREAIARLEQEKRESIARLEEEKRSAISKLEQEKFEVTTRLEQEKRVAVERLEEEKRVSIGRLELEKREAIRQLEKEKRTAIEQLEHEKREIIERLEQEKRLSVDKLGLEKRELVEKLESENQQLQQQLQYERKLAEEKLAAELSRLDLDHRLALEEAQSIAAAAEPRMRAHFARELREKDAQLAAASAATAAAVCAAESAVRQALASELSELQCQLAEKEAVIQDNEWRLVELQNELSLVSARTQKDVGEHVNELAKMHSGTLGALRASHAAEIAEMRAEFARSMQKALENAAQERASAVELARREALLEHDQAGERARGDARKDVELYRRLVEQERAAKESVMASWRRQSEEYSRRLSECTCGGDLLVAIQAADRASEAVDAELRSQKAFQENINGVQRKF